MTAHGQASVTWRARPSIVRQIVVRHAPLLTAIFAPPAAVALVEGEIQFFVTLAAPTLLTMGVWVAWAPSGPLDRPRAIEAAAAFVALFVLSSVLAVPAFLALGLGPVDAVFEAVSAFTSTGLTVAEDTAAWPFAGHLLRGWMQWSGGFAIAVAGIALLLGPGEAGHEISDLEVSDRDITVSIRQQARSLLVVYAAITVIGIAVLVVLMPTAWEGLVIALTAVSTGGMTPRADSLASYSVAAQVATMVLCLATTVSLLAYVVARRQGGRAALGRTNAGAVLGFGAVGVALAVALAWLAGHRDVAALTETALNALSGFTTAGFSVSAMPQAPAVLLVILVLMAIGGGTGSTAGGIKVDRIVLIAGIVKLAFLRLRSPSNAVTRVSDQSGTVAYDRLVNAATVFALYLATALVCWTAFLALGQPAMAALFNIISALSTVGLSTGGIAELPDALKLVLTAAMLLGRLEFVALLATLSPAVWFRNGG